MRCVHESALGFRWTCEYHHTEPVALAIVTYSLYKGTLYMSHMLVWAIHSSFRSIWLSPCMSDAAT